MNERAASMAGRRQQLSALSAFNLMCLLVGLAMILPLSAAFGKAPPESFADLAEKLSPAVVNISTSQTVKKQDRDSVPVPEFPPGSPFEDLFRDFFDRNGNGGRQPRKVTSLGSGFVIDPSGIIVTNNHVIEEADKVTVNFVDGSTLPAEVLGRDPKTDIAVLKVKSDKPLAHVNFGDADKARVGDWVLAIGNPFGLGGSLSAGIISARNRDINAGPYDDFIQTDAAINRGNSGGPLFDTQGQVIGVNTAIISPSGGSIGIGFAVPSSLVVPVVEQLKKYGETRRGWLGVRIQTVTDEIAESLSLSSAYGALVAGVTESGPAAKAGLKQGDVIVSFDGRKVEEMRHLPRMVAETDIGKSVPVEVIRDGKKISKRVKIERLEEGDKVASAVVDQNSPVAGKEERKSLGLTLSAITPRLRSTFNIEDGVEGVLVTEVDPNSAAAEKQIRPGDVIVEIGQEEVFRPDDVVGVVNRVTKEDKKSILLGLNRRGDFRFVAVRIDKS